MTTAGPTSSRSIFWAGKVELEDIAPGAFQWDRQNLHSAANLFHVQQALGLAGGPTRCYRVAWIGGCVLVDTGKLRDNGRFDVWPRLPPDHCGEDAQAQLAVMRRHGGCGIIPSGACHMELPTTVTARSVDAPKVLGR